MKVIYFSYHHSCLAFVAAALHIGIIASPSDMHKLLQKDGIMDLDRFYSKENDGILLYMGLDERDREIYIMGCNRYYQIIKRVQSHMREMFGIYESLCYVDIRAYESIQIAFGRFLYRKTTMKELGKAIYLYGIRKAYPHIVKKVKGVKLKLLEESL